MTPMPTDYVMGDALPGLLDVAPGVSWVGPVLAFTPHFSGGRGKAIKVEAPTWEAGVLDEMRVTVGEPVVYAYVRGDLRPYALREIRLSLTRPECRHRVCVVMAAGEREECERCIRAGVTCTRCRDGGEMDRPPWKRQPAPIWWTLPVAEGGSLPNEQAAWSPALIACSVARVRVGLGVVAGVLGPKREGPKDGWLARMGKPARERLAGGCPAYTAFGFYFGTDKEHLAAGFALANNDGTLTLPFPPT